MYRATLLILEALLVAVLAAVPASAQEGGQWLYHPTSGRYAWCAYYGVEFWCYTQDGQWARAISPEMMQQVEGWQPI